MTMIYGSDSDFKVDLESLCCRAIRLAVYKIRIADSFLSTDRAGPGRLPRAATLVQGGKLSVNAIWACGPSTALLLYRAVKRVLERQAARVLYRGEARQDPAAQDGGARTCSWSATWPRALRLRHLQLDNHVVNDPAPPSPSTAPGRCCSQSTLQPS